jgi:hypothetical protein
VYLSACGLSGVYASVWQGDIQKDAKTMEMLNLTIELAAACLATWLIVEKVF